MVDLALVHNVSRVYKNHLGTVVVGPYQNEPAIVNIFYNFTKFEDHY